MRTVSARVKDGCGSLSYSLGGTMRKLSEGQEGPVPVDIYERHRDKLEIVDEVEAEEFAPVEEEEPLEEWPLNMDPKDYLERYPSGPNADLARAYVEAE